MSADSRSRDTVADPARLAVDRGARCTSRRLASIAVRASCGQVGALASSRARARRRRRRPDRPAAAPSRRDSAAPVSALIEWPSSTRSSAEQRLAALEIAAEPEEIVGDAAGQRARIAPELRRIVARAAATPARPARGRGSQTSADQMPSPITAARASAMLADPREAAGHHGPAAVGVARREDAQREGPRRRAPSSATTGMVESRTTSCPT